MMDIRIRSFNPSDVDFIESLVSRFSEFSLPEWRQKEEIDGANLTSLKKAMEFPEPDSVIYIAEDETGKRAGFIHLQLQLDYFNGKKVCYISDLAVDAAFERHGIGRILLKKAEEWAYTQHCQMISLYVFSNNSRARRVYEKLGFHEEVIKYLKPLTSPK
ncbi:MAG: GNAT family N-acetyltransferase [Anaerolineales bacterium]|nr:GNAT family N-acetyltransferase [Anaerolineales bacterium]